jgi:hypothetical protein
MDFKFPLFCQTEEGKRAVYIYVVYIRNMKKKGGSIQYGYQYKYNADIAIQCGYSNTYITLYNATLFTK